MVEDLPRQVPARAGFEWVTGAFRLFFKSPLILAIGAGVFLGGVIALQFIPYAGPALSEVITPLIVAGFMRAFRTIDEGEEPELPQLLAGFRAPAISLAMIGAVYLCILVLILALMKQLGVDYEALLNAMQGGARPEDLAAQLEGKLPLLFLGVTLVLPALAATWYAPALVLFGNARPLQAMQLSLKACLRNWAALAVNGVALLPVLLFALIPLFGMMVVVPVMLGTAYLGYQALFASKT
jgi:uncharacterized membrane protein